MTVTCHSSEGGDDERDRSSQNMHRATTMAVAESVHARVAVISLCGNSSNENHNTPKAAAAVHNQSVGGAVRKKQQQAYHSYSVGGAFRMNLEKCANPGSPATPSKKMKTPDLRFLTKEAAVGLRS